MAETKKCNKKALIAVGILVVVLAAMAAIFFIFRPKPAEGSKSITIEVINSTQESKMYELKTDAEYLRQAMEEAKGLEFSGTESEEFGLTLITVNGEDTDFNNGSYWGIFVNGEYGMYGIDSQPVYDGDAFQIVYTVY
ncbi:MAG: DUF4430 domain-containing protein [Lachnospiraceae bacterium]|nr:DUF4430 domain-containing protein [Lachnospiraceae bacterium]